MPEIQRTLMGFHVLQTPLENLGILLLLLMMITMFAAGSTPKLTRHSISLAKPNCVEHCGNISIPFPFGTTQDCYQRSSFLVICNQSTVFNTPKLFFPDNSTEIIDISVDGQIKILQATAHDCYGRNGAKVAFSKVRVSLPPPFTVNNTANKFTIFGCDTLGLVDGLRRLTGRFLTGCVTTCDAKENLVGGSCLGSGCCQTRIPDNVLEMDIRLQSFTNYSNVWDFNNCGYAILAEEDAFNFSSQVLLNFKNITELPMVADWIIGYEGCELAKMNLSSYACKSRNSICYEPSNYGYRCRCIQGYRGNPYLHDGCQDINECDDEWMFCQPNSDCVNLLGSYECPCKKPYRGNGRRDNIIGCYRLPPSKMINVSIGLGAGMGSLLLLSICFWLHKLFKRRANKKQKENFFKRNGGLLLQQQRNDGTIGKTEHFPAKELGKATDNFNESRILGQGGQGTVYKGMLSNGQIVAIKKSKQVDEDQLEQFINEVVILSQINHRNVVKLLGCCLETEVPLLVYEFAPNGTLFNLIHDPNTEFLLSWNMRLKIAADIAGALAYLHSATSLPIYHRDIKTSNILLDEKYVVKVSDFGTSKSVTVDQTHVTTLVKGTFGYLDPEYFQSSQFTEKSDVYSFGVVLLELLTGQRAVSSQRTNEEKSLATRFLASIERDCLDEILDEEVLEQGQKEEVVVVARLAQRCLNLQGKMRPTMKEVATELESVRISQMPRTLRVGDHAVQEARINGAKNMMLSEFEYSWTTSGKSDASSSSDCHPLMFATV